MKIQKVQGMRDFSPEEMVLFRCIEGICRDCFSGWGYREVRTPAIEHLHLFTSAGTLTPGQLGKVYSFLDWDGWSGERVVLRPDGTIPVARLYAEKPEATPARLYYIENTFMFEAEEGRSRERWQGGVELIGDGSAVANAELVALSLDVLNKLGLGTVELRLSHAGLIRELLEDLGLPPAEQHRILDRVLDGEAKALQEVGEKSPEMASALKPLLSLKGQTGVQIRNRLATLSPSLAALRPCLEELLRTAAALDDIGIKYRINIASGAGFEYYTGLIFQLFIGKEKVGGGGRYDALIPAMGGGEVPAAGFALYIDRIMGLMQPKEPEGRGTVGIRITIGEPLKPLFQLAASLREMGYATSMTTEKSSGGNADWYVNTADGGGFVLADAGGKQNIYRTPTEVVKKLEGLGGR